MNIELMEALNILEKEKDISKDTLLGAIEQSLLLACKNHFGKADNVTVHINPDTCDFKVYAEKTVVEQVEDPVMEISLVDAQKKSGRVQLGDIVRVEIKSKEFGRIATQNAKNVILQKIREEERKVLFDLYYSKEKDVVTGIVQRYFGKHVSVNLGKVDAILTEGEQIKGEKFTPTERIKVYIVAVKDTTKGPKILVSRTHPELVKRLLESEVTEVKEGIVEIKSIAREAGSRSKIAVWSNDPDVDPVGACVGMNGARVNAIVEELRGEKIDIINWSENPALLIENALSPAKVIAVYADPDEKTALVVVPDYQLSLAIGREGQNARLAAHLTGFKIDIKSETQARESGELYAYEEGEESGAAGEEAPEELAAEALGESEELQALQDAVELVEADGEGEELEEELQEESLEEEELEAKPEEDLELEAKTQEESLEEQEEFEEEPEAETPKLEEFEEEDLSLEEEELEESEDVALDSEPEELSQDFEEDDWEENEDDREALYEDEIEGFYNEKESDAKSAEGLYIEEDEDEFDPESDFADLAFLELEEGGFDYEE